MLEYLPELPLPELPVGYLEACKEYPSDDIPEPDSGTGIWDRLADWHDYEEGFPDTIFDRDGPDFKRLLKNGARVSEEFKARILKAVFDGERAYIKNLLKAFDHDHRPQLEMHAIRAAMEAFDRLFVCRGLKSKDDWPTKQEVRQRAEAILKEDGKPPPTARHWPRILKQAGLSELPRAPWRMNSPATVYYLRVETLIGTFYKIGITRRNLSKTLGTFGSKFEETIMTILKTWKFAKASQAYRFEKKVLRDHACAAYQGPKIFARGNNELFTRDVIGLDSIDADT